MYILNEGWRFLESVHKLASSTLSKFFQFYHTICELEYSNIMKSLKELVDLQKSTHLWPL